MVAALRAAKASNNGAGGTLLKMVGPAGVQADDVLLMSVTSRGGTGVTHRVNHALLARTSIGGNPSNVAISPDGLYVYSVIGSALKVIRTSDNTVYQTVSVGGTMNSQVAVNPVSGDIYVAGNNATTVWVFSPSTWTVVATVTSMTTSGTSPLLPDPTGAHVYQLSAGTTVKVMRASDNTNVASVTVASLPRSGAWSPDGAYCYVTSYAVSGVVNVIRRSDHTIVASPAVGQYPLATCMLPDGSKVYVANYGSGQNTVSVIRTSDNTVVQTVSVGNQPIELCATPDSAYVYVLHYQSANVQVIRTSDNTVVATITLAQTGGMWMRMSPDGKIVYVSSTSGANYLHVIRTSDNTVVVEQSGWAQYLGRTAFTPDSKRAYSQEYTTYVDAFTADVWTQVGSQVNSGTDLAQTCWWRVAKATEYADYGVTLTPTQLASGAIIAGSGLDTAAPAAGTYGGQANASSVDDPAPSIGTWSAADGIDVGLFGLAYGSSFTPPTDYTEPANGDSASTGTTAATTSEVAYRLLTAATAVGSITATAANAAVNIGHHVFLPEAQEPEQPNPLPRLLIGGL